MPSKRIALPMVDSAASLDPRTRAEPAGAARISGPARPDLKYQEDGAGPRPRWIRKRIRFQKEFFETKTLVEDAGLHTICESGSCPNIHECWSRKSLTIMILGNICTRSCGFCDVQTGKPLQVDEQEPERVAKTLASLGLNYCVITSVDRDDLDDGGARIWADTIAHTKRLCPQMGLEVLTGDFKGNLHDLQLVLEAGPNCWSHNIETVEELHRIVRPQAKYSRSLAVLAHAAGHGRALTKTGMMLGLGETTEQTLRAMRDLVDVGVEVLNLGQYLRPSKRHLPVQRWIHPDEFAFLKEEGERMGFRHVESGPLVRSSYRADQQALEIKKKSLHDASL